MNGSVGVLVGYGRRGRALGCCGREHWCRQPGNQDQDQQPCKTSGSLKHHDRQIRSAACKVELHAVTFKIASIENWTGRALGAYPGDVRWELTDGAEAASA